MVDWVFRASMCRLGSRFSLTRAEIQEIARSKRHSLRYTDLQLTRSLLVVTTVFILLNIPNYAYRISIQFLNISDQASCILISQELHKNCSLKQCNASALLLMSSSIHITRFSFISISSTVHRWKKDWYQQLWNYLSATVWNTSMMIQPSMEINYRINHDSEKLNSFMTK